MLHSNRLVYRYEVRSANRTLFVRRYEVGATKDFTIHYPADYPIGELADTDVSYTVSVKGIKRRVLPELDDEFAKDLGEFENLDALRARVREDLEHEARHAADRELRDHLLAMIRAAEPVDLDRPERGLVKVNGSPAVPHRQLGLEARLPRSTLATHRRIVASTPPRSSRRGSGAMPDPLAHL